MVYDEQNVFSKILRGEIPVNSVYEDEYALAFEDINPQAPVHLLAIPKGSYVSLDDFTMKASEKEVAGFFMAVGQVAREAGLSESGYRILANHGNDANQEVPHFHVHIVGGRNVGKMISLKDN